MCISARPRDWISRLVHSWQVAKEAHVWSMQRNWSVTPTVALQDKSPRLARQLARDLNSRLSPVVRLSRQTTLFGKNWHFAFQKHTSINTPYTHILWRASRENFERKNPREKKRLTYPQFLSFDSPNSSTLTISIVTSLRCTLVKTFSHHTHICEKAIWCFRKQLRRD